MLLYTNGLKTKEEICAASGQDWRKVNDQLVEEAKDLQTKTLAAGLTMADVVPAQAQASPDKAEEDDPKAAPGGGG